MDPITAGKPKRRKKNKSRTQVSSDSESEPELKALKEQKKNVSQGPKELTDAEITASFSKFYMQRAAKEFAEDLDKIRGADDFRDDALPLLINALQQGTSVFSIEEQKRVITDGLEKQTEKVPE